MFTTSRLSSIALAVVTLAVAGTVAVAAPPSAAAGARWQLQQLDGDRCWDSTTLDADFNGFDEQVWFDLDNDCRWDTHQYSTKGGDDFHEQLSYDMNENGVPEYVLQDVDQRVGFDWAYIDANEDRRFEARFIIPGSSLDQSNRATNRLLVQMATRQTLNDFRRWTGRSLVPDYLGTP